MAIKVNNWLAAISIGSGFGIAGGLLGGFSMLLKHNRDGSAFAFTTALWASVALLFARDWVRHRRGVRTTAQTAEKNYFWDQ